MRAVANRKRKAKNQIFLSIIKSANVMSKEIKKVSTIKEFLQKKGVEDIGTLEPVKAVEVHMEFLNEIAESVNDAQERQATKEEMQGLKSEMNSSQEKLSAVLKKAMLEQGETIKMILTKNVSQEQKESKTDLKEELKSKSENLKAMAAGDRASNFAIDSDLSLKAVGDMTFANSITGEIPQAQRLAGVNEFSRRELRLLNLVSTGSITSNAVSWVYEVDGEGNPAFIAEGIQKPYMDLDFDVDTATVKKIAALVRVSDEMLEDVDFMERTIRQVMNQKLLLAVESQLYNGDGTGANLLGIRPVVPAFSVTGFAATVDNANIVDVLNVAINQITLAFKPMPTAILMHPSDVTSLLLQKVSATDKRYVDMLFEIGTLGTLRGIPIVSTTLVTQGQYLLGFFPYSELLQKGGVRIDIGYNADDFAKNFKTIRVEWRGVHFIQQNNRPSFVKGVFATDRAALETV
jgi:HK97 family phage major capsid protein